MSKAGGSSGRREVAGNVLVSQVSPAIRIEVDPAFAYLGSQSFVLYGVANAEQHLFVLAGAERRVRRLIWMQFEGYLPSNSHTYDYRGSAQIEVAGWPFYFDAGWMDRIAYARKRPDSDGAKMAEFLTMQGYWMGAAELHERYVTLSPDLRRELMVIYAEDPADQGVDIGVLEACGTEGEPWATVRQALHARATASFALQGPPSPGAWAL